jgi:hypothetical protein
MGRGAWYIQHRKCERDLSGAISDEAGLWSRPNQMVLANSIGIGWRDTQSRSYQ